MNSYDPYLKPGNSADAGAGMFVSMRSTRVRYGMTDRRSVDDGTLSSVVVDSVFTTPPISSVRNLMSCTTPPPASTTWESAGISATEVSMEWSCWKMVFLQESAELSNRYSSVVSFTVYRPPGVFVLSYVPYLTPAGSPVRGDFTFVSVRSTTVWNGVTRFSTVDSTTSRSVSTVVLLS